MQLAMKTRKAFIFSIKDPSYQLLFFVSQGDGSSDSLMADHKRGPQHPHARLLVGLHRILNL